MRVDEHPLSGAGMAWFYDERCATDSGRLIANRI